ncbi:hypothetical protein IFM89_002995 [Coptis chinensis]|uniref:Protein kinase domain-containing protein n=1 Tax=Coptis chinensis TaxID=261450 RepID=A0A835MH04_9MAGN|nr:hypothetical protein IFM89_002995 [Coptis chinensis]
MKVKNMSSCFNCLFNYVFSRRKGPPLSWTQRLKIAVDIARGLNYLHFDREVPHGNLKSTNILLDGPELNARVADYCLHRLMTQTGTTEQILDAGVLGYHAPELLASKKPSPSFKSDVYDVYAFGVIMLELLTGKCAGDVVSGEEGGVDLPDWTGVDQPPVVIVASKSVEKLSVGFPQDSNPFSALADLDEEDNDSSTEYQNALDVYQPSEDSLSDPGQFIIDLSSYKMANSSFNNSGIQSLTPRESQEDLSRAIIIAKPTTELFDSSNSTGKSMVIYEHNSNVFNPSNGSEDLSMIKFHDETSEELHSFLNAKENQHSCNGSGTTASEKDYFFDHTYEDRSSEIPIVLSPVKAISPISTRQQRKKNNQAKSTDVNSKQVKQGQKSPTGPSRSKNKKSLS